MNQELENLKIKTKENINLLINNEQLDEAKVLIEEYKEIVPNDIETYSIEAVILMLQGELEKSEILIKEGLSKDKNNFDLLYNLGYLYEKKESYLEALETYEKIIFNIDDNDLRKQIIEHLNKLEENNRAAIQQQLECRDDYEEEKLFNGKKINLHLMYDSQYCDKFIHFVNQNFPNDEHKFIITHNKEEKLKLMNVDGIENVEIIDLRYELDKLFYYIENCSRIFIHYLMDYFCEIVCRGNITKPIYWPIWGGDLYNYIDIELYKPITKNVMKEVGINLNENVNKNDIYYLYRRATIRKIKNILRIDDGDYEKVRANFITKAKRMDFIYFPSTLHNVSIVEVDLIKQIKSKYKYVFLIGNSANPTNNHLDILFKLRNLNSKDFCVIVPLSYGGPEWYIKLLINEGKRIYGERFIPLMDYYSAEEYTYVLKNIDVAFFAHNRQQGLGNIWTSILLERKIYIDTTRYSFFNKVGIKIYNINEVEDCDLMEIVSIGEQTVRNNMEKLISIIDIKVIYKYLYDVFGV